MNALACFIVLVIRIYNLTILSSYAEHYTMSANGTAIDVKAAPGRFDGISRPYSAEDVKKLRGSVQVEHTLARLGAEKLWELFKTDEYVPALGAVSGNQVGTRNFSGGSG